MLCQSTHDWRGEELTLEKQCSKKTEEKRLLAADLIIFALSHYEIGPTTKNPSPERSPITKDNDGRRKEKRKKTARSLDNTEDATML